jgi:hypothetical protein
MRGVPIAVCYTSVVVVGHYQELVPLLVIPDDAAEEGIAPICCIIPNMSPFTHTSVILPSLRVMKSIAHYLLHLLKA